MFAYQTIRIDSTDTDKLTSILKKYAKNKRVKYLVASEISLETNKPHLQGWIVHPIEGGTEEQIQKQSSKVYNNFRTTITPYYKTDKGREYSFRGMYDPPSYIPYIIHNSIKEPVSFTDLITNYSEDEYEELLQKYEFIEKRPSKLKKAGKTFSDVVTEKLAENCVDNGIIDYSKLMSVFMSYYAPTRVGTNPRRLKDILDGYTWRLEQRYPRNTRLRSKYYTEMCRLDDDLGIYKADRISDYLKLQLLNKNADEDEVQSASEDCSEDLSEKEEI